MARLSLAALCASMLSGCLIEDPPPYRQPTRSRPHLLVNLPPPNQIIVRGRKDLIAFDVGVRSEDAGEPLTAYLFLDYSEGNTDPIKAHPLVASTLDDTSRTIKIEYRVPDYVAFGCHTLMLRLSHNDNYGDVWAEPLDRDDVAELHWWLNIIDVANGDDGSVLRDCPNGK